MAATHSTPGAMVLKSCGSGPTPRGNKLTTITKKTRAAKVSLRLRSATRKSRRRTTIRPVIVVIAPGFFDWLR